MYTFLLTILILTHDGDFVKIEQKFPTQNSCVEAALFYEGNPLVKKATCETYSFVTVAVG